MFRKNSRFELNSEYQKSNSTYFLRTWLFKIIAAYS
jgi:hypothetical protein